MIEKQELFEVMNRAEAVYLATADGAVPRIRALVNLRRRDLYPGPARFCQAEGFTVYLATSAASDKARELRANPQASVYYCEPGRFHGLTLTGPVEILADPELKKTLWDESWRIYWPSGAEDPDYVILRMRPLEASGWWGTRPFQASPGVP